MSNNFYSSHLILYREIPNYQDIDIHTYSKTYDAYSFYSHFRIPESEARCNKCGFDASAE